MLKVIITGGIGSGKSTVVEIFEKYGIPIIDTDIISRELTEHESILKQLVQRFGKHILVNGRLDRRRLREHVFNNEPARQQLQDILHPAIHQQVIKRLNELETVQDTSPFPYCLIVIPLFVESGQSYPHDRVLVIDAAESTQLARASQRDQQDQKQIQSIMDRQADRRQRLAIADDVIDNNGSLEELQTQVAQLHQQYLRQSSEGP